MQIRTAYSVRTPSGNLCSASNPHEAIIQFNGSWGQLLSANYSPTVTTFAQNMRTINGSRPDDPYKQLLMAHQAVGMSKGLYGDPWLFQPPSVPAVEAIDPFELSPHEFLDLITFGNLVMSGALDPIADRFRYHFLMGAMELYPQALRKDPLYLHLSATWWGGFLKRHKGFRPTKETLGLSERMGSQMACTLNERHHLFKAHGIEQIAYLQRLHVIPITDLARAEAWLTGHLEHQARKRGWQAGCTERWPQLDLVEANFRTIRSRAIRGAGLDVFSESPDMVGEIIKFLKERCSDLSTMGREEAALCLNNNMPTLVSLSLKSGGIDRTKRATEKFYEADNEIDEAVRRFQDLGRHDVARVLDNNRATLRRRYLKSPRADFTQLIDGLAPMMKRLNNRIQPYKAAYADPAQRNSVPLDIQALIRCYDSIVHTTIEKDDFGDSKKGTPGYIDRLLEELPPLAMHFQTSLDELKVEEQGDLADILWRCRGSILYQIAARGRFDYIDVVLKRIPGILEHLNKAIQKFRDKKPAVCAKVLEQNIPAIIKVILVYDQWNYHKQVTQVLPKLGRQYSLMRTRMLKRSKTDADNPLAREAYELVRDLDYLIFYACFRNREFSYITDLEHRLPQLLRDLPAAIAEKAEEEERYSDLISESSKIIRVAIKWNKMDAHKAVETFCETRTAA
jgi:hypothetical protein